jgi:hypothetical protein
MSHILCSSHVYISLALLELMKQKWVNTSKLLRYTFQSKNAQIQRGKNIDVPQRVSIHFGSVRFSAPLSWMAGSSQCGVGWCSAPSYAVFMTDVWDCRRRSELQQRKSVCKPILYVVFVSFWKLDKMLNYVSLKALRMQAATAATIVSRTFVTS